MITIDTKKLWLSVYMDLVIMFIAFFAESRTTLQIFCTSAMIKIGLAMSLKEVNFKDVDIEVRTTNIKVEKTGEVKKEIDKI